MKSMIEACELSKQYRSQKGSLAVDGLNLDIPKGQLYGLVGPDGAGKTTALRILSTVLEQSSGEARVVGFDVRKEAEKVRKHIGYMPQNFSLYPDLSVIENLNFFADAQTVPRDVRARRIPEMLRFTRLEDFQKRRAANLSGGMKKKLALACALIHEPEVLLLDEPSTGVDPVSRRELWAILSGIVQDGVTVLVSTPYMDEAERCEQVGVIYNGKLLTSGSPGRLTSDLPFMIVEVRARPRKDMRRIVSATDGIIFWRPVGDRLRLAVANPSRVMRSLSRGFRKEHLQVKVLRETRPTMEDVFVHVVESQRGDHESC